VSNDINKKNREIEFIKGTQRSRNFLFRILMMILFGFALYTTSFFVKINPDTVNILILADTFLIIILSLYWYLQVQPLKIKFLSAESEADSIGTQKKLEAVFEIQKALLIYDTNVPLNEQVSKNDNMINEVVKYISARTYIFPYGNSFRDIDSSILTNEVRRKLFGISLDSLKSRLLEQNTKEEEKTKNKSDKESDKDKSFERMTKLVDMATTRLQTEIAQLSKRADIYIIFGSGITLIGGLFLYFTVQELLEVYKVSGSKVDTGLTASDIFSVVIRFSIVIFVEVFAFYYLRLYRNIMENIKYYQNEITNVEMKILSLHALEGSNCSESLKILTSELAKTERNFVIDKNKTTVDLERNKLETDFFKSSTDNFVKLVKSIKA